MFERWSEELVNEEWKVKTTHKITTWNVMKESVANVYHFKFQFLGRWFLENGSGRIKTIQNYLFLYRASPSIREQCRMKWSPFLTFHSICWNRFSFWLFFIYSFRRFQWANNQLTFLQYRRIKWKWCLICSPHYIHLFALDVGQNQNQIPFNPRSN